MGEEQRKQGGAKTEEITAFGDVTEQYKLYRRKRLLSRSETITAQRHMIQLDEMHSALPMFDLGSLKTRREEERRRFLWWRLRRERGGGEEEEGKEGFLFRDTPLSKMTNELPPPPLPWRPPTCDPQRGEDDGAPFFDTLTRL